MDKKTFTDKAAELSNQRIAKLYQSLHEANMKGASKKEILMILAQIEAEEKTFQYWMHFDDEPRDPPPVTA